MDEEPGIDTVEKPDIVSAFPRYFMKESFYRISHRFFAMIGALAGLIVSSLLILYLLGSGLPATAAFIVSFVLFFLILSGFFSLPAVFNLMSTEYRLNENSVESREGFLKKTGTSVQLDRIENLRLERNIWERTLGTGTIFVYTAGSGTEEMKLYGISKPEKFLENLK